ncbi:MAG: nitroreductase family protein [Bacteroidales bacterium]
MEQEKLDLVLEAARVAPSAVNFQPWHVHVIRDAEDPPRIREVYHREWFRTSPCVLVLCADHSESWKRTSDGKDHADVDVSIAADHMTLQATALGLATCWVCNFDAAGCRDLCGCPITWSPWSFFPWAIPSTHPKRVGTKPSASRFLPS